MKDRGVQTRVTAESVWTAPPKRWPSVLHRSEIFGEKAWQSALCGQASDGCVCAEHVQTSFLVIIPETRGVQPVARGPYTAQDGCEPKHKIMNLLKTS